MLRRVILPALAGLLLMAPGASAATLNSTWDESAATVDYPVYQPADTAGLKLSAFSRPMCPAAAANELHVRAVYGNSRTGSFSLLESFPLCKGPGEERVVRRVKINGTTVDVAVNCRPTSCHVRASDGPALGFRLLWRKGIATHTFIDLRARHLSLAKVLRVARSLTRVTLDRPNLQLLNFLSPDRQIWCALTTDTSADATVFCGSRSAGQSGEVGRAGNVTLCNHPNPSPDEVCLQNFDDEAHVLNVGQTDEYNGFRCVSELQGITCTVSDGGPGTGRGFTINTSAVTPVGL